VGLESPTNRQAGKPYPTSRVYENCWLNRQAIKNCWRKRALPEPGLSKVSTFLYATMARTDLPHPDRLRGSIATMC